VFPPPGHTDARVGSVVTLVSGTRTDHILLGPTHGGLTVTAPDDDRAITVVTPGSPLGRALLGLTVGATLPPSRKGTPAPRLAALA
jgi:transcription elongation GreA/GreB family factor